MRNLRTHSPVVAGPQYGVLARLRGQLESRFSAPEQADLCASVAAHGGLFHDYAAPSKTGGQLGRPRYRVAIGKGGPLPSRATPFMAHLY
jgi:hypothetical protein